MSVGGKKGGLSWPHVFKESGKNIVDHGFLWQKPYSVWYKPEMVANDGKLLIFITLKKVRLKDFSIGVIPPYFLTCRKRRK